MNKKTVRVINGLNVDYAEEHYDARYVGSYSIPGVGDGPFLVFYTDNPDRTKGHDNYFGLYRHPLNDEVHIFNAGKIRAAIFSAIEIAPGDFLVSRSVHDYVTRGNAFLDGGPYYTRYNPNHKPTHTMTIVDGYEVFTTNVTKAEPGQPTPGVVHDVIDAEFVEITALFEENGLTHLLHDVRVFHHACDQPVLQEPTIPTQPRVDLRIALIEEEWIELQEAVANEDIVEIADALGDIVYVVVGMALEFGLPLDRVWAEIQASNMAKVDSATGKARKFPNGKVMKPDGWQPPNVRRALGLEPV